jgi:ParB family chromosome partitioning protein
VPSLSIFHFKETTMTTQQTIPLNCLIHSKANARRTGKADGIGELAASIDAHGLRQNLNVLPCGDGRRFEVVAGSRRLRALKQLAKAGKLAKDAPVSCLVLGEGNDPAEISLAENVVRTSMHPDDQFEAFRGLIEDKNASPEDVAARFGVTPAVVRQRLKLANVSPKLRAVYRKGEMGLEHVMALAISDDHEAQEEAWANLPDWNRSPSRLKQALTSESVALSDRLAVFVGVEAYMAAGGAVLRDLFDEEDEGYLSDAALLQRLVTAKMEEALTAVQAEGWKWVKPEFTRDYSIRYGRIYPLDDEGDEAAFTVEDKARCGALVTLGHDGALCIERGLIHPDDAKAEAKREREPKEAAAPTGLSAGLVAELTAHRTAALRIELARSPAVALAATVHALALPALYSTGSQSCLDIRAACKALAVHGEAVTGSRAHQAMGQEGERWGDRLPGDAGDLFAWCLAQPQDALLDLLAYLAGLALDAVQVKGRADRHDHADRLAEALSLDMREWWTPTVEGFYQRLPKSALAHVVADAKVPPLGVAIASLSKAEAVRLVAGALEGTGWLPEPLRTQSPALSSDAASAMASDKAPDVALAA